MQFTERFVRNLDLTLFSGKHLIAEPEADSFYMSGNEPAYDRVTVKDTVVSPDGWEDFSLSLTYERCSCDAPVEFAFGKTYANERTAAFTLSFAPDGIRANEAFAPGALPVCGEIRVAVKSGVLCASLGSLSLQTPIDAALFRGYTDLCFRGTAIHITAFSIASSRDPYTEEEHKNALLAWRHAKLDETDAMLDRMEKTVAADEDFSLPKLPRISLPRKLTDAGDEMDITVSCGFDTILTVIVTEDAFGACPVIHTPRLVPEKTETGVKATFSFRFARPGNTKIEVFANGQARVVRTVGVLAPGYLAVIPWVGANTPAIDTEIHRYDLPGDCWSIGTVWGDEKTYLSRVKTALYNSLVYGDHLVPTVNGSDFIPDSETDNLFELDEETQRRGLHQLMRRARIIGAEDPSLIASYTPDALGIRLMEEAGYRGLTSLCVWQNWQDGGWKINHWGAANQPYYPADEDFRRAGEARGIMCFSMANSSCSRNYSIMTQDSCPTLCVPGERYFGRAAQHFQIARFYDAFEGYLKDVANTEDLLCVTVPLENFRGAADWQAANELAVRYMVKRAENAKILFTSAADVADYHIRKKLPMQSAFFYQKDTYYGYHNGDLPGRVADRIEVETPVCHAVYGKGRVLPLFFYDYTAPWKQTGGGYAQEGRSVYALVNHDKTDTSRFAPEQASREGLSAAFSWDGDVLSLSFRSPRDYRHMGACCFDLPFAHGFTVKNGYENVTVKTVTNGENDRENLVFTVTGLPAGETVLSFPIAGERIDVSAGEEWVGEKISVLQRGERLYFNLLDCTEAVRVTLPAKAGAYVVFQNGTRAEAKDGTLSFSVNDDVQNEAPIGYGLSVDDVKHASVTVTGTSKTSHWSW